MYLCWSQACSSCTRQTSFNWLKFSASHHISTPTIPSVPPLYTISCGVIFIAGFGLSGRRCGVDEIKQATVNSSQDRGSVVDKMPSSSSAAIDSNADIWRSSHPGAELPLRRYIYRQRSCMFSERRRVASLRSARYNRSVDWYRRPHSRR